MKKVHGPRHGNISLLCALGVVISLFALYACAKTQDAVTVMRDGVSIMDYFGDLTSVQVNGGLTGAQVVRPSDRGGAFRGQVVLIDLDERSFLTSEDIVFMDNVRLGYSHQWDIQLFAGTLRNNIIQRLGLKARAAGPFPGPSGAFLGGGGPSLRAAGPSLERGGPSLREGEGEGAVPAPYGGYDERSLRGRRPFPRGRRRRGRGASPLRGLR